MGAVAEGKQMEVAGDDTREISWSWGSWVAKGILSVSKGGWT